MPAFNLPTVKFKSVRDLLERCEFNFTKPQYTVFQAKYEKITATLYESGKFLIQGKEHELILKMLFEQEILMPPEAPADCWMGIDEAGKGDLFGPLVIAGVTLDKKNLSRFFAEGVRDSKELSPPVIRELAIFVRKNAPHDVVAIGPEKYNELYEKFQNLNRLLAWGHSKVCENLLSKSEATAAIFDQFAGEHVLENALKNKKGDLRIIQRTKGEEDMAVAAASILARDEFVRRVYVLGNREGLKLPLGCSNETQAFARKIKAERGAEFFRKIAKAHFKI
ncbi:MAG: ribonuclease HIII [Candidatus Wallbacteria bacterium]|nr:ribonuclease HIII [Candidatus Wallbacteria bacterium]